MFIVCKFIFENPEGQWPMRATYFHTIAMFNNTLSPISWNNHASLKPSVNHTEVNTIFSYQDYFQSHFLTCYTLFNIHIVVCMYYFTQFLIIIKYRTYWQFKRPSSPYTKSFWVHFLTPNNILQILAPII